LIGALTKPFKAYDTELANAKTVHLVNFYRVSHDAVATDAQAILRQQAASLLYRAYTNFSDVKKGKVHAERPLTRMAIL